MELTEPQKRHLRGLAHHLSPCVHVGNAGVTPGVLAELDGALAHHELLKVKVRAADRGSRNAMIEEIASRSSAAVVTRIGNIAVLYRPDSRGPRLVLPGPAQA